MDRVIKLKERTIKEIEKYRTHPRETWNDLINKILSKLNGLNNLKM